ncbi:hypothetical protein [Muricoccus radiodurans]|uniref:hypothetical protein n=1 Tax=Muricoccus radiodurans TaxID=2231721 RepID=UPI003CF226CB
MRSWMGVLAVIATLTSAMPLPVAAGPLPPTDGSPFPKAPMGRIGQAPRPTQGAVVPPPPVQPLAPAPMQARPQVPQQTPQSAQGRAACAAPLRQGCETMQASCRMACPPMWNPNPGAPAFTPTDRAGCTQQCFTRYLACLNLYGCS